MGLIAKILGFTNKKIKGDCGGGNLKTAEYYSPAGDDSLPLPDDSVALLEITRSGGVVAVGVKSEKTVNPGEKKLFARSAAGDVKGFIYLKNTGAIRFENDAGFCELTQTGQFIVNGVPVP